MEAGVADVKVRFVQCCAIDNEVFDVGREASFPASTAERLQAEGNAELIRSGTGDAEKATPRRGRPPKNPAA